MYFRIVKQRQSSNTEEGPQAPFIEISSTRETTGSQQEGSSSSLRLSSTSCHSDEEIEVLRQDRINNVSPDNKVSVVEVQWFVQPK